MNSFHCPTLNCTITSSTDNPSAICTRRAAHDSTCQVCHGKPQSLRYTVRASDLAQLPPNTEKVFQAKSYKQADTIITMIGRYAERHQFPIFASREDLTVTVFRGE